MRKKEDKLHRQFLPSALEIIETPPSPLGYMTIWIIFAIIGSAILWACVGEVDQIAQARGKVIPHGQIKTLQTSDQGIITGIFVEEGDHVKQGDTLLQLDSTLSEIDFDTAEKQLEVLQLEKRLLEEEMNGETTVNTSSMGLDSETYAYQLQLKDMRHREYDEKKHLYEIEITKANKDQEKAGSDLEYYEKQNESLKTQEDRLKKLYESGSVSKTEYQEKADERSLIETKVRTAQIEIESARETIASAEQNLLALKQNYDTELVEMIVQKDKEILEAQSELDKQKKRYQMYNLTAPVDGKVSGIGAHTIGGVVTSAQTIVTIVPDGTPLVVEATVLNKDIGFIKEGQACDIKLDAFPFQKYGVIEGHITYISPDAFEDENLGYVYKIRVKPDNEYIQLENKTLNMNAGMTASVEVKLDRRKIIEFFLPAIDYVKESFEL